MKSAWSVLLSLMLASTSLHGEIIYSIDFSQYGPGTMYTNASGAPSDFSSYSRGYADSALIESQFQGLLDQPLVNSTTNASSSSVFGLATTGFSNHVLTLSLSLVLDSQPSPSNGSNAKIGFYSDVSVGNQVSVFLGMGWSFTNGGSMISSHLEVVSRDGPVFLPSTIFATNSIFHRDTVTMLSLSINTYSYSFDVYVEGSPLVISAPLGNSLPITGASIELGDIITTGSLGNAAIDNILLTAHIIPEPSTIILIGLGLLALMKSIRTMAWSLPVTRGRAIWTRSGH